eukprot:CAMPEP_0204913106 /NCGR_PEP_ID=MMETSP1397-20131031/11116_1 /ASSEMBLY_ACC=CAM_ASM_000891 /TAXON_ID=49980 /ORGANISM="Climacostomum Climacostomum virens, Strain Stock W-24" /LENGTH=765 /DNA_ID=CAMNT_0052084293 /DNA_START=719 /DNA_END=3016 /DNA_ORIENTATION=-
MEGQRRLVVKSVAGQTKQFQVSPDISIEDLKKLIAAEFGTPADRQRLIFQGKLLKDGSPLSEYIREDDLTIHMMARAPDAPEGGPGPVPGPAPGPIPGAFPQGLQFIQEGMNAAQGMFSQFLGNMFPGQPIQILQGPEIRRINPTRPPAPPHHHHRPPAPASASPSLRPEAPPAEGHRREFSLPFPHVSNVGSIVNGLMGPGAAFPPPRMPALNVERNPLVLLGGYLSNYQFQLLRLLPFISRIGDLMQRESLITDPQERMMLQEIANRVGDALSEVDQATSPIVELLRTLQVGPQPGQFRISLEGHPVIAESQVDPRQAVPSGDQASQPQVPEEHKHSEPPRAEQPAQVPQAAQVQAPPVQAQAPRAQPSQAQAQRSQAPQAAAQPAAQAAAPDAQSNERGPRQQGLPQIPQFLQSQLSSMIGSMFGQGPNSNSESNPTAVAFSTISQFLTGGVTLRQILMNMGELDIPEIPLTEFFLDLNFAGLIAAMRGNLTFLQQTQARVRENIRALQARGVSVELSSLIPGFNDFSFREAFLSNIEVPETYNFDDLLMRRSRETYAELIDITLNYEGQEFTRRFYDTFSYFVGEMTDNLANSLPRGEQQIFDVLMQGTELGMGVALVRPMLAGHISRVRQVYLKRRQAEAAAQQPVVSEASRILQQWQAQIERDQQAQVHMSPQRPLSIAYRSADPFNPTPPVHSPTDFFFETIQATFIAHDIEIPGTVPVALIQAHEGDLRERLRERASSDPDFSGDLFPALDRTFSNP